MSEIWRIQELFFKVRNEDQTENNINSMPLKLKKDESMNKFTSSKLILQKWQNVYKSDKIKVIRVNMIQICSVWSTHQWLNIYRVEFYLSIRTEQTLQRSKKSNYIAQDGKQNNGLFIVLLYFVGNNFTFIL